MLSDNLSDKIERLSPEKRSLMLQRLKHANTGPSEIAILRRKASDPRVLSFGQQQLWLVDQLTPGESAYNVPYPVRIRGPLDRDALHRAIDAVVGRHEVLRTLFLNLKGHPFPAVSKQASVDLCEIDLRHLSAEDRSRELKYLLKENAGKPFDLARDLKLRAWLYRLADEECVLLHVSHHISWDLRSKVIFYEELAPLYRAYAAGSSCELPDLPIQYADFALWQRRYLQGEVLEKLENYWKQRLCDAAPKLELPADHSRPPKQGLRGAKFPMTLSDDELAVAARRARQLGATLYMLLLAAFKVFLFSYTSQEDISVGSPFAGRRKETDAIIGMFINTLVLRTTISADMSFSDVVGRVRETTLGAIAHQDLPFEKIVEAVRPPRDLSRNALFQVNFRLQNSAPAKLELATLETESLDLVDNASAKFDLALELPSSAQSRGYFEYNTDLFEEARIARMADHFHALLRELLDDPQNNLMKLNAMRTVTSS